MVSIKAYVLKAAALRKSGRLEDAIFACNNALERDPFNLGALFEKAFSHKESAQDEKAQESLNRLIQLARGEAHNFIAYVLDYASAGLYTEAVDILTYAVPGKDVSPMVYYHLGYFTVNPEKP